MFKAKILETEDLNVICWVFVTDFIYADLQINHGHGVPDARGLLVLSPNFPQEILWQYFLRNVQHKQKKIFADLGKI